MLVLGLYIAAAIIGGGLVLVSALGSVFGHGADGDASFDHDVEVEVDGDIDLDHDMDHDLGEHAADAAGKVTDSFNGFAEWIPFLSLRFWVAFTAAFGILGLVMTLLKSGTEPGILIMALITGFLTGTVVHTLITWIKRHLKDSSVEEKDLVGVHGKVLVPARGADPGKIRIEVKGDIIDLLAVSDDGRDIDAGSEIFVVAVEGNHARIARQEDLLR